MSEEMKAIKQTADEYKALYQAKQITRQEAAAGIMPYIEQFNTKSAEIAKKYGMRPKKITFAQYMR